jgi:aminoglycoside phosphotransferase (APT) family kinase protein
VAIEADPTLADHLRLEPAVRDILASLGLSQSGLHYVESYSHTTWMTDEVVVRRRIVGPTGRLLHEAAVAACLPPEALYPEVVASGRSDRDDWLVTVRVRGEPLIDAWPRLSRAERERATHEVAAALRALHGAPAQHLRPPCLFGGEPVIERSAFVDALVGIARSARAGGDDLGARVCLKLEEYRPVIDDEPSVMAHHDLNFGQCIWGEDGHLAAILDLEMSHANAPDWDLTVFLTKLNEPRQGTGAEAFDAREFVDVPRWFQQAYPELFSHPSLRLRLRIYELVQHLAELTATPDLSWMREVLERGTHYEHLVPA